MTDVAGTIEGAVVAASAAAAAFFAWRGIDTWRRQLKGQAQWEIARSALRAAYKVRDALNSVRSPFMSAGEEQAAVLELDPKVKDLDPNSDDAQKRSLAAAYQVRWREVQSALSELDLIRLEAEAMLGAEAADAFKPLYKKVRELNVAVLMYLRSYGKANRTPKQLDQDERNEQILWGTGSESDEFGCAVQSAVSVVEGYYRPKLK